MSALLLGYARCSTDQQDLTAQLEALLALGVETERIDVDHGLPGTNRQRPGLREALAGGEQARRLARSLPDARAVVLDELITRQISLSLGGPVYDPTDASIELTGRDAGVRGVLDTGQPALKNRYRLAVVEANPARSDHSG